MCLHVSFPFSSSVWPITRYSVLCFQAFEPAAKAHPNATLPLDGELVAGPVFTHGPRVGTRQELAGTGSWSKAEILTPEAKKDDIFERVLAKLPPLS